MIYKDKHEMNEGDTVAGVVYAAAAEELIRREFERETSWKDNDRPEYAYQPTVIGYMVRVDDVKGEMDDDFDNTISFRSDSRAYHKGDDHWSQVDLDRREVLRDKRNRSDLEYLELAAINRRLGYDVTG